MSEVSLAGADDRAAEMLAALNAATIGARGGAGESWSDAFIARLLALPGVFAFVARSPEPAGFVLCLPAGEAIDIAAIGVLDAARRNGIGRKLVAVSGARARAAGAARLMLEVATDNAAAIAFYRALGFTEVGQRPNYYAATPGRVWRDALVLSKALQPAAIDSIQTKI